MPIIDKNQFFRQVTDSIYNCLDINEVLKCCQRHLIQVLPCTDMSFVQYDLELNAFKISAKIINHLYIKDVKNISIWPKQVKKLWKKRF